MSTTVTRGASTTKKYKAACDKCNSSKVKCPGGGPPCQRCADSSYTCKYSLTARIGKPLGSKNKKTLERLRYAGQVQVETNSRDASIDSSLDAHVERDDSNSPREAFHIPNTPISTPMLPLVAQSSLSSSSRASPPLASDLFDVSDTCNDSNDMSALWSGDMVVSDLDNLGRGELGMPWTGAGEDNWNLPLSSIDFDPLTPISSSPASDTSRTLSLDSVVARLGEDIESTAMPNQQILSRAHMLCQCLRKYSDLVSQLQTIEERQQPIKLDTLLTCANVVLAVTESRIQCPQCLQDTRVLMQLAIIFQTMMTWTKVQCRPASNNSPDIHMVLGRHELTWEECSFVKTRLLARLLNRTSTVLSTMMARTEQVTINRQGKQAQAQGEPDFQSFQQMARSLIHGCRSLAKGLSSGQKPFGYYQTEQLARGFNQE